MGVSKQYRDRRVVRVGGIDDRVGTEKEEGVFVILPFM